MQDVAWALASNREAIFPRAKFQNSPGDDKTYPLQRLAKKKRQSDVVDGQPTPSPSPPAGRVVVKSTPTFLFEQLVFRSSFRTWTSAYGHLPVRANILPRCSLLGFLLVSAAE